MTFKLLVLAAVALSLSVIAAEDKVMNVGVLDSCMMSEMEKKNGMKKMCPAGTSCRKGACNCDDLPDGTIMSHSPDMKGAQMCRRIAGQKCTADDHCHTSTKCTGGMCTCIDKKDCADKKDDAKIVN